LRGFNCNASLLIAGYQHYISSEYNYIKNAKRMSDAEYASAYYKYHAFQADILIRLRKSCEPDKKSLAAGAIANLLSNDECVLKLKEYIQKSKNLT
jgi:hypothetical protein